MTDDNKAKPLKVIIDEKPTSATDIISVAIKGSGDIMLRLGSSLPDNTVVENHRTLMNAEVGRSLIDTLCSGVDYYPTKPKTKKK